MMQPAVTDPQPMVQKKGVALYPADMADVERIRAHFQLDSFSQALRRAIRIAVQSVDESATETKRSAA